jgi:hypothetical protein
VNYSISDVYPILDNGGSVRIGEIGRLVMKRFVSRDYDFSTHEDGVVRSRRTRRRVVFVPSKGFEGRLNPKV